MNISHPVANLDILTQFIYKNCVVDTIELFNYVKYDVSILNSVYWTGYIRIREINGRIHIPPKLYPEFKYYLVHCANQVEYRETRNNVKSLRLYFHINENLGEQIEHVKEELGRYIFSYTNRTDLVTKCLENSHTFLKNGEVPVIVFRNIAVNSNDLDNILKRVKTWCYYKDLYINGENIITNINGKDVRTTQYYIYSMNIDNTCSFFTPPPLITNLVYRSKMVRFKRPSDDSIESVINKFEMQLMQLHPVFLGQIKKDEYEYDPLTYSIKIITKKKIKCANCPRYSTKFILKKSGLYSNGSLCKHQIMTLNFTHILLDYNQFQGEKSRFMCSEKRKYFYKKICESKLNKQIIITRIENYLGLRKRMTLKIKNTSHQNKRTKISTL